MGVNGRPHDSIKDPDQLDMIYNEYLKIQPRLQYQPPVKEYDVTFYNPKTERKEYYVVDIELKTNKMIRARLAQW